MMLDDAKSLFCVHVLYKKLNSCVCTFINIHAHLCLHTDKVYHQRMLTKNCDGVNNNVKFMRQKFSLGNMDSTQPQSIQNPPGVSLARKGCQMFQKPLSGNEPL